MTAPTVAAPPRVAWIDRVRGLAIVLMILDHTLAVAGEGHWVRVTLTRLSLPLFCACAGLLARRGPRHTNVLLVGVMIAEVEANAVLGLGLPGPVMLIWFVSGFLGLASEWMREAGRDGTAGAWWIIALGLVQALYVPVGWTGYEPGLVLAWLGLGWALGGQLLGAGERLPRWLGTVGRYPLHWYLGHLAVLLLVVTW